jgi:hypothetical protein
MTTSSSAEVKNGGDIDPLLIHLHGVVINQLFLCYKRNMLLRRTVCPRLDLLDG